MYALKLLCIQFVYYFFTARHYFIIKIQRLSALRYGLALYERVADHCTFHTERLNI